MDLASPAVSGTSAYANGLIYRITPLIRINWCDEPSGYAENPDYWIFLFKYATLAVCSSAVTIYSKYLRLRVAQLVEALRYKSEGRGFDYR